MTESSSDAATASSASPFVVLVFFQIGPDQIYLENLLRAVRAAPLPPGAPAYIGTYGPNANAADEAAGLPTGLWSACSTPSGRLRSAPR
jgi:hypothetical protein